MRLINADALHDNINKETYRHTYIEQIHSIIDNTPTIEAEPVLHCKDCKHYIDPQIEDELGVRCVQWHTARFTREDDFCSYGERREK